MQVSPDDLKAIKSLWWSNQYQHKSIEAEALKFKDCAIRSGWIRSARQALFLSGGEVAKRLGITRQTYLKMETREDRQTLAKMREIAEAMDCEFIYTIRPKSEIRFSDKIWNALTHNYDFKGNNLRNVVFRLKWRMYDPQFRKNAGWCRNNERQAWEITYYLKSSRSVSTGNISPARARSLT